MYNIGSSAAIQSCCTYVQPVENPVTKGIKEGIERRSTTTTLNVLYSSRLVTNFLGQLELWYCPITEGTKKDNTR